jgi:hypothetical protein
MNARTCTRGAALIPNLGSAPGLHARGAYVNALAEDDAGRVKDAYGSQYTRLAVLKKKYDPENVFRLNPNVPPRR